MNSLISNHVKPGLARASALGVANAAWYVWRPEHPDMKSPHQRSDNMEFKKVAFKGWDPHFDWPVTVWKKGGETDPEPAELQKGTLQVRDHF